MKDMEELERLLKSAKPRKAAADFKDTLLDDIERMQRSTVAGRWSWRRVSIGLAAAAVLALCVVQVVRNGAGAPRQDGRSETMAGAAEDSRDEAGLYVPAVARSVVVAYEERPLAVRDRSLEQHRYHLVDYMEWHNRKTGNRYCVVRPRQATVITTENVY